MPNSAAIVRSALPHVLQHLANHSGNNGKAKAGDLIKTAVKKAVWDAQTPFERIKEFFGRLLPGSLFEGSAEKAIAITSEICQAVLSWDWDSNDGSGNHPLRITITPVNGIRLTRVSGQSVVQLA